MLYMMRLDVCSICGVARLITKNDTYTQYVEGDEKYDVRKIMAQMMGSQ